MNNYWIEIKRFLDDNKINIIKFSILFAILFAGIMFLLKSDTEESKIETEEDVQISPEEFLNESQPAYFQMFIQEQDGRSFSNNSIISQYFKLSSVKKNVLEDTGIDLEKIEEDLLDEIAESMDLIQVTRNDHSNLITASFNLGNQRQNVILANYYFDLIIDGELEFLNNKTIHVFSNPQIAKLVDASESDERITEDVLVSGNRVLQIIYSLTRNLIIGLILGAVFSSGIFLLINLYSKKINYSFSYDIDDDTDFVLYDWELNNENEVLQFVAVPMKRNKLIVSERELDTFSKKLVADNKNISFENSDKHKTLLTELRTLSEVDLQMNISEIVLVIQPGVTTRKWYKTQQKYTSIYKFPTKVVQINPRK